MKLKIVSVLLLAVAIHTACGKESSKKESPAPIGQEEPLLDQPSTSNPQPTAEPTVVATVAPTAEPQPVEALLKFSDIESIVTTNCAGCHAKFSSKQNVIAARAKIVAVLNIENCRMPKNKPEFCASVDGLKLATWASGTNEE